MHRWLMIAFALAAAFVARAEETPEWNSIIVRFTIDADGKLHVSEEVQVDVPPAVQQLERTYWSENEQKVTFQSITMYDGERTVPLEDGGDLERANHFRQSEWPGKVVWSVRDKNTSPGGVRSLTYVIESTVSDAVIPAWSIPRGKLSMDGHETFGDPRRRLREVLPLWREALKNPRHRYLVDYQFEMPPPSTNGTRIQLQIYWPRGWEPVHEIVPDTVARPLERDAGNPDAWRVTHLFEEDGRHPLPSIDVRHHAIRMVSLIGFPIVALLFWILFVLRELLRRGLARGGDADDEQLARGAVFKEAPEVIQARWSGDAAFVSIEPFLRRLERERKLAIVIEQRQIPMEPGDQDDDDDANETIVTLRLLVPREQLTPYERAGIDALIPDGWETSSEDIQKRHEGTEFDPSDALRAYLVKLAAEAKKAAGAPWYSRLTSLALFVAGVVIAFQDTIRNGREPAVTAAILVSCSMLYNIWPDSIIRPAVRARLAASLLLLIPLVLMTAAIVFIHFTGEIPPGFYGSAGLAIAYLGTYKALLAGSASRDTPEVAQLARARRWLRNELKSERPRLRDDSIPWLTALGLGRDIERWRRRNETAESRFASSEWTGRAPVPADDEEWGAALMTLAS
jgi:hypothetical protein